MSRPDRAERVCWGILLIAGVNWFVFAAVCLAIGGDGWGGRIEDGRYYVCNHGVYTEVSRATFVFTKVYVVASIALLVVGTIAGLLAALMRGLRESEE